ncbi:MAG: Nif3-like dinuclear metal center hexameric protein [Eubacteriaceae bacterium]
MSVKLKEICKLIEYIAPKSLAEEWDNVGLQLGSQSRDVNSILLTLDITTEVIEEAILKGVDLIIAHHPFIFKGIKNILSDSQMGMNIEKLIKNNIAVYIAHTNLDKSDMGLNTFLAQKLGLKEIKPLEGTNPEVFYKLVLFTPKEFVEKMTQTLGKYGAGAIGNYDFCTFQVNGKGAFRPLKGSKPSVGTTNVISELEEVRIESILPKDKIKNIINELKKVHPYEEMAYDVYPLENGAFKKVHGNGKIGMLPEKMTGLAFVEHLKTVLEIDVLKGGGKMPEFIRKVGICSGSGAEFIGTAKSKNVDAYITGDLKYHDGQRANEMNLWVLDAGHFGTEKWVLDCFKVILAHGINENKVKIYFSEKSKDFMRLY